MDGNGNLVMDTGDTHNQEPKPAAITGSLTVL